MADEPTVENQNTSAESAAEGPAPAKRAPARKRATKAAATPAAESGETAESATEPVAEPASEAPAKKAAAKRAPAKKAAAKRAPAKRTAKKVADAETVQEPLLEVADAAAPTEDVAVPAKKTTRKRAAKKTAEAPSEAAEAAPAEKAPARKRAAKANEARSAADAGPEASAGDERGATRAKRASKTTAPAAEATQAPEVAAEENAQESAESTAPGVLFQAPEKTPRKANEARSAADAGPEASAGDERGATRAKRASRAARKKPAPEQVEAAEETPAEDDELEAVAETAVEADAAGDQAAAGEAPEADAADDDESADESSDDTTDESGTPGRRRRRRGGRRRRRSGENGNGNDDTDTSNDDTDDESGQGDDQAEGDDNDEQSEGGTSRRRRRRRRAGESGGNTEDDPENTVTRVRESRPLEQQITAVSGSTRLEAKKQRRREGREAGRRRAPIVSEAEFLARRESVERVMVIRQRDDLTQIGVLEDKVLVEHYVARESQTSLIGNIYLGRVQNVLPSMEAAFVDIGKGRNAVLYAGEVNWSALGWKEGQPRKIESVLSSGQTVLVQVTKDPIGHKGARLTSQISLAGRFLVYVPDGTTSGISRKLPDTERHRLKALLKEIVPDSAGVIVRTAAEGAAEDELTRDVERLKARWEDIEAKTKGSAPQLLYGEPDLTLKVVRDLFTEDFAKLVIQGDDAWDTVKGYVDHVAPDLAERLERFVPGEDGKDAFLTYRIEEQIAKGLDRKVWLPSGGSLIIDRTEAMTVVDVNTGKFTGSGGNLEETVTKNNLEAAEEIVRQLRLRDIGGIIVVDFIDMVLESNRDLVLRRLVECLGRDRTRHQVAEVTSLGLVQMTRKRIGTGLLEAFSENCPHCHGRGVITHEHPVEEGKSSGVAPDEPRRSRRRGGKGRGNGGGEDQQQGSANANNGNGNGNASGNGQGAGQASGSGDDHHTPTPAEFAAMARHHEDEEAAAAAAAESTAAPEVEASDVVEAPEPAEAVVVEDFEDTTGDKAPAADEPAEAPAVKVVTRTRRRGASRPAGVTSDAAPVAPVIVEAPALAVPATEEVAAPEPPKVITRTRRGASRSVTTPEPAAVEATTVAPAPETVSEAAGEAPDGVEEHPVEHVPVKKKGARKR